MATTTLMIMRLLGATAVAAAPQQALELYPAAPMAAASEAYWNSSLNSWGGSVYNDSVRAAFCSRCWTACCRCRCCPWLRSCATLVDRLTTAP